MYFSQAIILVAVFLCARLALVQFGNAGFGQYLLFRRASSFLSLAVALGLSVAAPRLLLNRALQTTRWNCQSREILLDFAVTLALIIMTFVLITAVVGPERLAALVLGGNYGVGLGTTIVSAVVSFLVYLYAYESLRLSRRFWAIFLLQSGYFFVLPLLALLLTDNILSALDATVAASLLWAALFSLNTLARANGGWSVRPEQVFAMLRESVAVAPIPLITAALFAIPTIVAVRLAGDLDAGYMAFALLLLSAVSQLVTPFNVVFRGHLCMLCVEGEVEAVRTLWSSIVTGLTLAIVLSMLLIAFFGERVLTLYFAPVLVSSEHKMLIVVVLLAIPGYLLHLCAFSFLEAVTPSSKGVVINIIAAFGLLLAGVLATYFFSQGIMGLALSLVGAFSLLGCLAFVQLHVRL